MCCNLALVVLLEQSIKNHSCHITSVQSLHSGEGFNTSYGKRYMCTFENVDQFLT